MDYFHRRNRPETEFSGHEEASEYLRFRIALIWKEFVLDISGSGHWIPLDDFNYALSHQFPGRKPVDILERRDFAEVFTLVEVLLECSNRLSRNRATRLLRDIREAFRLSGSVYEIKNSRVELAVTEQLAEKLAEVEAILTPHERVYKTFYTAVGDLLGRRRKADDIVKDLFVATEGYLKVVTGQNDFGAATKYLAKAGALKPAQKAIMDKLYAYRSDAEGAAHSGNSPRPTEVDALWFLETILAQIGLVDRRVPTKSLAKAS